MAVRMIDFESVGTEKKKMQDHHVYHPDHVEKVLPDKTDADGPKLQLHLKLFLEEAKDPLSPKYFDNLEILLQLGLSYSDITVETKGKIIKPFKVPVHLLDMHTTDEEHSHELPSLDP